MSKVQRVALVIAGLLTVTESIYTPGLQLMAALVGGGLIGWNIAALTKGD